MILGRSKFVEYSMYFWRLEYNFGNFHNRYKEYMLVGDMRVGDIIDNPSNYDRNRKYYSKILLVGENWYLCSSNYMGGGLVIDNGYVLFIILAGNDRDIAYDRLPEEVRKYIDVASIR